MCSKSEDLIFFYLKIILHRLLNNVLRSYVIEKQLILSVNKFVNKSRQFYFPLLDQSKADSLWIRSLTCRKEVVVSLSIVKF